MFVLKCLLSEKAKMSNTFGPKKVACLGQKSGPFWAKKVAGLGQKSGRKSGRNGCVTFYASKADSQYSTVIILSTLSTSVVSPLYVCLYFSLSVCLSVCLSLYLCLSSVLSVYVSLYFSYQSLSIYLLMSVCSLSVVSSLSILIILSAMSLSLSIYLIYVLYLHSLSICVSKYTSMSRTVCVDI